jgi:hypothetical protein
MLALLNSRTNLARPLGELSAKLTERVFSVKRGGFMPERKKISSGISYRMGEAAFDCYLKTIPPDTITAEQIPFLKEAYCTGWQQGIRWLVDSSSSSSNHTGVLQLPWSYNTDIKIQKFEPETFKDTDSDK